MNLYIARRDTQALTGIKFDPSMLAANNAHLVIASRMWDKCFIELLEDIPEGVLKFLPEKVQTFAIDVPEHPSLHQLHLICELMPEKEGTLRKLYMKGESIYEVLPEVWEHRDAS